MNKMPPISIDIKETFKLAIPIAIGQLGHIMMGVVDSMMVGRLGSASLAAASLVNGLFFLVIVLGLGMSMAITPLVAMAAGADKKEDVKQILNNGFLVNMVYSVILIILTYLVSCLIPYLNQPKEVVAPAMSYLRILIISIAPFIVFQVFRSYLEGLSDVKPPMVIAILINILHVFFNWILIFGKFGLKPMGLNGAGIATTFSRIIMMGAILVYVYNYNKNKDLTPDISIKKYSRHLAKKIIQIGFPSGIQYFTEVTAFAFSAIMIGWFGSASLAAHQVALNLASVTYMIILGLSSAGTIRVGTYMGARDYLGVRRAGFTAIIIAECIELFFSACLVITHNVIPHLYISDPAVVSIASNLLLVAAVFQLADGIQATTIGVLRGLTDVKMPLIITFASYWIIAIPLGYLIGVYFNLGAVGVWIGLCVGLFLIAFLCVLRFNHRNKILISQAG